MRRAACVGAITGVGLTVGLKVLHAAGVGPLPLLDDAILRPAELLTWLFVLGDVGTPLQYALWPLLLGCAFNGALGLTIGALCARVLHWSRAMSRR